MTIVEIISWISILGGALLGGAGGIGIHRCPDFYSRLHAVGITDTLCAALFLFGLGLQAGLSLVSFKLFLIFVFLFFNTFIQVSVAGAKASDKLVEKMSSKTATEEEK